MDRNTFFWLGLHARVKVALRKESVDRNFKRLFGIHEEKEVALRKESLDRNSTGPVSFRVSTTSLSARRAWIEMLAVCLLIVAIRGRSPQGERG